MICPLCDGHGLILICYRESRDYDAAACVCSKGKYWRVRFQLKAWAKRQSPQPSRIGGIEDFYTDEAIEELRTLPMAELDQDVGGIPQVADFDKQIVSTAR